MHALSAPVRVVAGLSVFLSLAAATLARPAAGPTIKLVQADGTKVSDITTIVARATADGDTGIDKVEFSVDDQLKATDTSTPYSFDWDTLEETEGSHTITAVAFDSKGQTAKSKITLTIDNELGKGAEAHADTALAALKEGNVKDATRFSRRALKIDPKNLKAARSLAGIYRARGEYDKGVEVLEKVELSANEVPARQELVALYIGKADVAQSTDDYLLSVSKAGELYKKLVEIKLASIPTGGDPVQTAIKRGDVQFAARNWTAAIREYQKAGDPDTAPIEGANRLMLAFINAGRLKEADNLGKQLVRAKRNDAVTIALQGLMYFNDHKIEQARATLTDGIDNKVLPALIVGSYVDIALGKLKSAQSLAESAVSIAPDLAETQMLSAYIIGDPTDQRKALVQALGFDPTMPEGYVLRGYQLLLARDAKRFESADPILDYALKMDPKSNYALMAKVLSMMAQRRPNEAEPLLVQLLQQDPNAPDVHTAQALNLSLLDKTLRITEELKAAFKLDQERWNDVFVPKPIELIPRVYRYRFSPVLSPASLYPSKA